MNSQKEKEIRESFTPRDEDGLLWGHPRADLIELEASLELPKATLAPLLSDLTNLTFMCLSECVLTHKY